MEEVLLTLISSLNNNQVIGFSVYILINVVLLGVDVFVLMMLIFYMYIFIYCSVLPVVGNLVSSSIYSEYINIFPLTFYTHFPLAHHISTKD